jgi:hypothetical protein
VLRYASIMFSEFRVQNLELKFWCWEYKAFKYSSRKFINLEFKIINYKVVGLGLKCFKCGSTKFMAYLVKNENLHV